MYTGTLRCDLLLDDVRSLKQKRSLVRPLVAGLHRTFTVAAAQTGDTDLLRRAEIAVAVVAGDPGHCHEVLDRCEQWLAGRGEVELLAARRQVWSDTDE